MSRSWAVAAAAALLPLSAAVVGQDFGRVRPPVGLQGALLAPDQPGNEDPGRPVQMLESPNIDRFLHKAQGFLSREDYPGAIRLLQDVIEGRTLEDPSGELDEPGAGENVAENTPAEADAPAIWTDVVETSENAVFSADGRLYHPVRRLCHELLASLPPEGVAYYRTRFEVDAERALAEAEATFDPLRFEAVYERYFLTRAAGRAMRIAGDLLMDAGRLRAAIRAYRLLLDVYPEDARREIGVDDTWIRFRVATCFAMIGESSRAREEIDGLVTTHPDASLRLQGELVAVADLRDLSMFAQPETDARADSVAGALAFRSADETLVPLFEHRFDDENPYRPAKGASGNQRVVFVDGGSELTATPRSNDFVPGTSATFDGGRLALMNHFRLEVLDLPGGHLLARNDGTSVASDPQPGVPRLRIPVYDFSTLRVTADDMRYFVVIGPSKGSLPGMKPVTRTTLEAWSREDMAPLWSSKENPAFDDVSFLSAPTVFGSRILVTVANRGSFGVMCFESATGELVFHAPIHRDGTDMTRPPAVPVAVSSGVAYVLTNAGALAALDAYTGAIRWIRRYERAHPFRPTPSVSHRRQPANAFGGRFFQELALYGFAPSDLVLHDGLVVLAPCDGGVLICVDGASGDPVWMAERDEMQYVIGHDGRNLYFGGPDSVTCIVLRTGVRLWRDSLPPHPRSSQWRGRGAVANGKLFVPGERAILVRHLDDRGPWNTLRLPSLQLGREPLMGEFNVFHDGAYLAAVFEGGVELYSTVEALTALADQADDPLQRASLQAQAGDLTTAVSTLESIDLEARPESRPEVSRRMLTLCSELALALASHGARDDAVKMLDRCRARLTDARLIQRWHLARIEVFQALGDLDSVAHEQEALYELMGKRG